MHCPFCKPKPASILETSKLVFAMRDAYPVSKGHALVIPRRHVASVFELDADELRELAEVLAATKRRLDAELKPDGYNVGVNIGGAAGQTVMHAHVHVIPRYTGDVPNPRGGIRHAVVGKGYY